MGKQFSCIDGLVVPVDQSFIKAADPWKLSGRGVFETMRSYNGRIAALDAHLRRLTKGLKALNIKSPYTQKSLKDQLGKVIKKNNLKDARVRLTVWQEKGKVRLSAICLSYEPYSAQKYKEGFKAAISGIKKDESSKYSNVKSIDYGPFLNAYRKAERRGHDEAILLNRKQELVEGSRTNIFFARNNVLYTPALKCGCLNGITRQIVIKIAKKMNIQCRPVSAKLKDLLSADEAFLTNSLLGVMPLTRVEGQAVGEGTEGPMTAAIMREYGDFAENAAR